MGEGAEEPWACSSAPARRKGELCTGSAGRAERRKRTEAALEPAGRWLWGSCWGGLGHPWEQRAWCEPLAGRPGCRMSCLPELSDWRPGDWRLWAWRGASPPGLQNHCGEVCGQGPWALPTGASLPGGRGFRLFPCQVDFLVSLSLSLLPPS